MSPRLKAFNSTTLGTLIPRGQRKNWVIVIVMGIVVAGAEAIAAMTVAALIAAMSEASVGAFQLPIVGSVADIVPGDTAGDRLRFLAIVTAAFFILKSGLLLAKTYVQARVAHMTGANMANRLFEGYLAMPYSFHINNNSSELMRNASWAADEVVATFLTPVATILAQSAMLILLLGVLIATAPIVTLVTIGVLVPLVLVIARLVRPRLHHLGTVTKESVTNALNSLQQSLHGIRDVKVLGRERYFGREFRATRWEMARARYQSATLSQVPSVAVETLVIVTIIVFVAINSTGGIDQSTLPTLALFAYAGMRMMPAVSKMVAGVNSLRYGQSVAETLAGSLRNIASEASRPPPGDVRPPEFAKELVLEDVLFAYDSDSETLKSINLEIKRGESIGIVGETGAGKTTLLDVILGLLTPNSGSVRVDSEEIRDVLRGWHRIIGLVPQTIYLLDDTIRRNIAYGLSDDEIDDEAVEDAVELAQLSEFLATLPHGIETVVGERGVRLSGGQRQRVAIARALYRKPKVLIFDEGTASLDNLTEAELLRAIERLRDEHTILTVAHRLSTVKNCDRVILLEKGEIRDEGTYEELRERNVTFRRMTG